MLGWMLAAAVVFLFLKGLVAIRRVPVAACKQQDRSTVQRYYGTCTKNLVFFPRQTVRYGREIISLVEFTIYVRTYVMPCPCRTFIFLSKRKDNMV